MCTEVCIDVYTDTYVSLCVICVYCMWCVSTYIHTHKKQVCTHLSVLQCALTLQWSRLVASYQCLQAMCLTVYSVCGGRVANANVLFLYWCVHDTQRGRCK